MNAATLRPLTLLWLLASTGSFAAQMSAGDAAAEDRVIRTTQGFRTERAPDELRNPFTLEESRTGANQLITKLKARGPDIVASTSFGDSWIYDASTELFYDLDRDGYYHYLRVQFDADTIYDNMLVYAEIYLSADGVAWEHLFTTDDFRIWGTDPDDDYEVETELVSGYSTGQYDVLIELYDANYGDLLDEFGPDESSALSLLPLEDSGRDGVGPLPVSDSYGGGGAMSWPMLAALLASALAVRRRRLEAQIPVLKLE